MPDYPYEGQLIADPVSFQRAVSAQVTVYDAADTTNSTPLALKDASGVPTTNPLTSSSDAFVKPIYAPSQDIKYVGAGLTVFVSSAVGMRDAAEAAAAAAQDAANTAVTAVADSIATAAVDGAGALVLTKANGTTVNAGNVRGAKGDKGDPGAKGLDGANVLPTAEAIAQAVTTDGPAKTALSATIDTQIDATKGVELAPMATVDHPAGVVLKSAYDPRTRSYNLNQSTLSKARAAHARGLTGGKPMQLHFLGHSYMTGFQSAAPYPTNTSPAQVTRALDASGRVGKVAEGHRVLSYGSTVGARLSDDTRFTLAPEWTYISGHGYALSSVYRNIANTGDLTFAPGVPITHFEVVYLASTVTGAWTFSTNGGAGFAGTGITATNPTIGYYSRVINVSADPAVASLIIRPPATGHVMIQSIRAYTDTATIKNAIEVTNAAVSGSTAAGATVGSWTHSLAGYASTAQAVAFYKPDLACIMLGTNDRNAAYTKESYINAMRTLANQVKAAGGDVIFLREPTPTEQGFTDGLYGLADEIGAGIIEVGPDWPTTYANSKAEPYGYIGVDNGHPSPRGHTAIARAITGALLAAL